MQTMTLVDADTAAKWDAACLAGSGKKYPNLDLVRLEKWFFKSKPGLLLEYAFGCGVNMVHLLECGYVVEGIDASVEAKKLVERKLATRPDIASRATLTHLQSDAVELPYKNGQFDFVNCLSLLSLLGSRDRVEHLLSEFKRVMKPDAKIIVDINSPNSDFAHYARPLENDVYETKKPEDDTSHLSYCPKSAQAFAEIVERYFVIDDVGYSAHKYFHSEIEEFIVCAHKT